MSPDPEFDARLWEEALRFHQALVLSGAYDVWRAELTDDEVIRIAAPILGAHCSSMLLQTRVDIARAFGAAETLARNSTQLTEAGQQRRNVWKKLLASWVGFLSRLRPGSLREVQHFHDAESPGLLVAYDDRHEHPEVRYVAWPSSTQLALLGIRQEKGGDAQRS